MTEMTLSPLLLFLTLILTIFIVAALYLLLRVKAKSTTSTDPIIDNLNLFGEKIQKLSEGQERLTGGLQTVSEAQAKAQLSLINMMEERLSKVQLQMSENLSHSSRKTAQSLGDLQQRVRFHRWLGFDFNRHRRGRNRRSPFDPPVIGRSVGAERRSQRGVRTLGSSPRRIFTSHGSRTVSVRAVC